MKTLMLFLQLLLFVYEGIAAANAQCPSATLAAENMTVMINGDNIGAGIIMAIRETNIYITTARHVIAERPSASYTVTFRSGEKLKVAPNAIRKSSKKDLAFLVMESHELAERLQRQLSWKILRSRSAPRLSTGSDRAIIVGQGGGEPWVMPLEPERISSEKDGSIKIQSTTIQQGFSGGGVFDPSGSLIGVIMADEGRFGEAIPIDAALNEARRLGLPVDLREIDLTPVPIFIAPLTDVPKDRDQLIRENVRDKLEQQLATRGFRLLECEGPSRAIGLFGAVRMSRPTFTTEVAIVTWKFNHLNGLTTAPEPQHVQFYSWFGALSEHVDEVGEYVVTNFMKEFSRFDMQ